jgi:hypothetical protein
LDDPQADGVGSLASPSSCSISEGFGRTGTFFTTNENRSKVRKVKQNLAQPEQLELCQAHAQSGICSMELPFLT